MLRIIVRNQFLLSIINFVVCNLIQIGTVQIVHTYCTSNRFSKRLIFVLGLRTFFPVIYTPRTLYNVVIIIPTIVPYRQQYHTIPIPYVVVCTVCTQSRSLSLTSAKQASAFQNFSVLCTTKQKSVDHSRLTTKSI